MTQPATPDQNEYRAARAANAQKLRELGHDPYGSRFAVTHSCVAARALAGRTARQILGWREITALLENKIDRATCVELVTAATRQYAKRQLTWFRSKSTFPAEDLTDVTSDHLDRIARRWGLS
jgi:hypothetical protein